jgi:hypothetical protein
MVKGSWFERYDCNEIWWHTMMVEAQGNVQREKEKEAGMIVYLLRRLPQRYKPPRYRLEIARLRCALPEEASLRARSSRLSVRDELVAAIDTAG